MNEKAGEEDSRDMVIPFEEVFRDMSEAALVINEDGRIMEMNERASELFSVTKDQMVGHEMDEFLSEFDLEELRGCLESSREDGMVISEDELIREEDEVPVEARFESMETERGMVTLVLIRDITERKKEGEKEDFLHSLLRHDLRNKIQVNRGYLQLLLDTDLSEKQREFVEKAMDTIKEGNELIEKVRRRRGIKEEISPVDIREKIEKAVQQNETELEEKRVDVDIQGDNCRVKAGQLLVELFSNLVSNSITHACCDSIRFVIEETDERCEVHVMDDGEGVEEEVRGKLFKEGFANGDNAGSGLGLYFVQIIAESYGGSVEAEESDLGGLGINVILEKA